MKLKRIALALTVLFNITSTVELHAKSPNKISIPQRIRHIALHSAQTFAGILVSAASLGVIAMGVLAHITNKQLQNNEDKSMDAFKSLAKNSRNILLIGGFCGATTGVTSTIVGIKGLAKDFAE